MKNVIIRIPFVLLLLLPLAGCGDEATKPDPSFYLDQTSEENVLKNLQVSYRQREIVPYAAILADDFRFYFDEGTRAQNSNLPVSWDRSTDTLQTKALFESPEVTDIRIDLRFGAARPVTGDVTRQTWSYIDVLDTFLEVDLAPKPGELEGLTLRVDGQQQRFFFRKGKSAADTLASSATSKLYYIVEWKDFGMQGAVVVRSEPDPAATWGRIGGPARRSARPDPVSLPGRNSN